MDSKATIDKYRVAAPRYTSYPTVPYWDTAGFNEQNWITALQQANTHNDKGISLYIHLPFCESLCTYCGCNTRITKNHNVEQPYIQAVLKEWQMYVDLLGASPTIKEIHLGGGTPTFFSAENLEKLIFGILSHAELHGEAKFSFEAHPGNTSAVHLVTLFNMGFRRLSLGIQDFDPEVQHIINRVQSVECVEKITKMSRQIGYHSINYDLIYGLPLQNLDGLKNTIQEVVKLMPDRIAFYSYAHTPWLKPGQRRYTEAHLPSVELKNQLYEAGRTMLLKAGYHEIGMDHFTLASDSLFKAEQEGKLHRNFMGYTEQGTEIMIGLGVSSISDSTSAFAQNVKTVEEYLDLVNQGLLPVFKGHILSKQDLVLRQHILNIMCKGQTSWRDHGLFNKAVMNSVVRLHDLAEDRLITLSENALKVTPKGKRFLRNICMAFDQRLWDNKPETQMFSLAD